MKCLPCMRACMHVCVLYIAFIMHVCLLYIAFIYEDIFTKFAENVYGCENMCLKNFVLILKKTTWPP